MKFKLFILVLVIIPLLISACSESTTNGSDDISPPSPSVIPTIKVSDTSTPIPPSPTASATPSPLPPTSTPTLTATEEPIQSPVATIKYSEVEIFCPSENDQAVKAYGEANDLKDQGKYSEAEQLYLKAIELDPGYCDAMDNLGQMLRMQDRLDEAKNWYLKSLEIKPDNIVALQNLAIVYQLQGEIDQAIEVYQKLLEIAPENPEGYYGLGNIFFRQDQFEKAFEYLEQAEKLYIQQGSPYVSDAQHILGYAHYYLQNYVKAKEYLQTIYEQYAEDGGINYVLGICYLLDQPVDVDKARQYILKAQELGIEVPAEVLEAIGE